MVDQGNEVRLARAARADEERVVGAGRGPQITDPLHERFQDRLAHHEQASEQVLRHGRGGETRDGDGTHRRSHPAFLRAQMYWRTG